ncbi:MAG: tetratricopeptide repeat protein [Ginsengibacter sp.]
MAQLEVYVSPKLGAEGAGALGLVKGDIPTDNKENMQLIEGMAWRISALHESHYSARKIAFDYKDRNQQFALYLRNFGMEVKNNFLNLHSFTFESWLRNKFSNYGISLLSLRGGTDSLSGHKSVFSTNSDNWLPTAEEIVSAANIIIIYAGELSNGLLEEIKIIRKFNKQDRCVIAVTEQENPSLDSWFSDKVSNSGRVMELKNFFSDFPNIYDLNVLKGTKPEDEFFLHWQGNDKIDNLISDGIKTNMELKQAFNVDFSYLEPKLKNSTEYALCKKSLDEILERLDTTLNNLYWQASPEMLEEPPLWHIGAKAYKKEWYAAHYCYGLAFLLESYAEMIKSLSYLAKIHTYVLRNPDWGGQHLIIARQIASLLKMQYEVNLLNKEHAIHSKLFWATAEVSVPVAEAQSDRDITSVESALALAESYKTNGDLNEAEKKYKEASLLIQNVENIDIEEQFYTLSHILFDWAALQYSAGKKISAENRYLQSLEISKKLSEINPKILENYSLTTFILNNLGVLYFSDNDFESAEGVYSEALEIRRILSKSYPDKYSKDLALSLYNMGIVYVNQHKLSLAEQFYLECLDIRKKLAESSNEDLPDQAFMEVTLSAFYFQSMVNKEKSLSFAKEAYKHAKPFVNDKIEAKNCIEGVFQVLTAWKEPKEIVLE